MSKCKDQALKYSTDHVNRMKTIENLSTLCALLYIFIKKGLLENQNLSDFILKRRLILINAVDSDVETDWQHVQEVSKTYTHSVTV